MRRPVVEVLVSNDLISAGYRVEGTQKTGRLVTLNVSPSGQGQQPREVPPRQLEPHDRAGSEILGDQAPLFGFLCSFRQKSHAFCPAE